MLKFNKMKSQKIVLLSFLLFMLAMVSGCNQKNHVKEEGVYYTCPMHPDIIKEEPGQCPVCAMDLVKKNK